MYLKPASSNTTIYLIVLIFSYLTLLTTQQGSDSQEYISEPDIDSYSNEQSIRLNCTKFNYTEQVDARLNPCKFRRKYQFHGRKSARNNAPDRLGDENGSTEINIDKNNETHAQENNNRKHLRVNRRNRIRYRCREGQVTMDESVDDTIDKNNSPVEVNKDDLNEPNKSRKNNNRRSNKRPCKKNRRSGNKRYHNHDLKSIDNRIYKNFDQPMNYTCPCDKIRLREMKKNQQRSKGSKQNKSNGDNKIRNNQNYNRRGARRREYCKRFCNLTKDLEGNESVESISTLDSNSTSGRNIVPPGVLSVENRFLARRTGLVGQLTTVKPKIHVRTRRPTQSLFHNSKKDSVLAKKESNLPIDIPETNPKYPLSLRPQIEMNQGTDTVDGPFSFENNKVVTTTPRHQTTRKSFQYPVKTITSRPQTVDSPKFPQQFPSHQIVTTQRAILYPGEGIYYPNQNNNMNAKATTQKTSTNDWIEFRTGNNNSKSLKSKQCVESILLCCKRTSNVIDIDCFKNRGCELPLDSVNPCSMEMILMARENFLKL